MSDIYVGSLFSSDHLEHFGIKGMRWGVRRYEDRNGKLTSAGKKRYSKKRRTPEQVRIDKMRKDVKNRRTLSDKDLDAKIERLKKESELKRLTNENLSPGRTEVANVLKNSGKNILGKVATGVGLYAVKYALTKKFNVSDFAGYVAPKPKNK